MRVFDNFLSDDEFIPLQELLLKGEFPWYFNSTVSEPDTTEELDCYFTHTFYKDDASNSPFYQRIRDTIIKKLCDDFLGTQWEYRSLIRLKANLYPQTNVLRIHGKHQDFSYKHTAVILYINSNDGYTEFEDGRCIESIENRLLVFDGSLMHNSTNCTNRKARVNLGLNYF